MYFGWYWTEDNQNRNCEVLDVNGSLVEVEDSETGERLWRGREDVCPAAVDEWLADNGQFGVGA